jgi:putative ubiquitin-RnfH superfamily antitoxin RatB of RatAB toxin-antitoxin module
MTKRATQKERLIRRLAGGKNLTVNEAIERLGIQSLSARIHELRLEGFPIYTSRVRIKGKTKDGEFVTVYRLNLDSMPRQVVNKLSFR